jgi:N6-adenosine-specific RNA methylase IME4
VILIDPPYNNTGCKLGYRVLDDREWADILDFDKLIEDGFILIWVTNAKVDKVVKIMRKKGWKRKETITWAKFDRFGRLLPRGGYHWLHTNE